MDKMVKLVMIVNEYMPLKRGIALLEIVIGLVILGVAGSIVVPSFLRQIKKYEYNRVIAQFDTIVTQAGLNSIKTGKTHRVKINPELGLVVIEKQTTGEDGALEYVKVPLYFSDSDFILPKDYKLINFYIDGTDECAQHGAGRTIQEVFFLLYPRGHTQAVVINILNESDTSKNSHGGEIGLVLNPFRLQFEVHDAFQKP